MNPAGNWGTSSCAVLPPQVRVRKIGSVCRSAGKAAPLARRHRRLDRAADHRWLTAPLASGLPELAADRVQSSAAGFSPCRLAYADERLAEIAALHDRRFPAQRGC